MIWQLISAPVSMPCLTNWRRIWRPASIWMPLLKSRGSRCRWQRKNSQGKDDLRGDQHRSARECGAVGHGAIFVEPACLPDPVAVAAGPASHTSIAPAMPLPATRHWARHDAFHHGSCRERQQPRPRSVAARQISRAVTRAGMKFSRSSAVPPRIECRWRAFR